LLGRMLTDRQRAVEWMSSVGMHVDGVAVVGRWAVVGVGVWCSVGWTLGV
jgi:hypothetical protein